MKKKFTKKMLSLLLVVVLSISLVVGLTACNEKDNVAKAKDTLVVGTTATFQSVNRLNAGSGQEAYNYDVYSGMVSQLAPVAKDASGNFTPLLTTFTINEDSTIYTFTVIDGMKWHDGTAVTSDDLVFTINNQFKGESGYGSDISSVEKVDGKTAKVTLNKSNFRFLNNMTTVRTMPKHILEKVEGVADGVISKDAVNHITQEQSVVGCGPFKFSRWDEQAGILEFVKFDGYPYADKIAINKIIFKTYKNTDVLDLALQKGEINMEYKYSGGLSAVQEQALKEKEGLSFTTVSDVSNPCNLFFNTEKVDKNIRLAIKKAIDYDNFRSLFGTSGATPSTEGFVSPANIGAKVEGYNKLTRDLEGAKQLLTAAGYNENNKLNLTLLVRSDHSYAEMAKVLRTYLNETGAINLTTVIVEPKTISSIIKAGNYDLYFVKLTAFGMGNQGGLGSMYFGTAGNQPLAKLPTEIDGEKTAFGTIIDNLKGAESLNEYKVAAESFQNYVRDEVPAISMFNDGYIQVYESNISGFTVDGTFGLINAKTWETLKKA